MHLLGGGPEPRRPIGIESGAEQQLDYLAVAPYAGFHAIRLQESIV